MSSRTAKKYYAYVVPGGKQGVAYDWKKCEAMVLGKPGARYRGFERKEDAEQWLAAGAVYEKKERPELPPGIYFDSGTGRGNGVEVSVTDEVGKSLLHHVLAKNEINQFKKHAVADPGATNNYGELLALKYALEIALRKGIKKIFGDSKLIIDYWSRFRIKRKEVSPETVALADEVSVVREQFEDHGGSIERISGDWNPADLGFHK